MKAGGSNLASVAKTARDKPKLILIIDRSPLKNLNGPSRYMSPNRRSRGLTETHVVEPNKPTTRLSKHFNITEKPQKQEYNDTRPETEVKQLTPHQLEIMGLRSHWSDEEESGSDDGDSEGVLSPTNSDLDPSTADSTLSDQSSTQISFPEEIETSSFDLHTSTNPRHSPEGVANDYSYGTEYTHQSPTSELYYPPFDPTFSFKKRCSPIPRYLLDLAPIQRYYYI